MNSQENLFPKNSPAGCADQRATGSDPVSRTGFDAKAIMNATITRRDFSGAGGASLVLVAATPQLLAATETPTPTKRTFKKAIMWATVGVKGSLRDKMKAVKAAGFDGVEMMSHLDQAEVLKAREEAGIGDHECLRRTPLETSASHPDPKVREEGLSGVATNVRDAKAYGASSVLLVAGRGEQRGQFRGLLAAFHRTDPAGDSAGGRVGREDFYRERLEQFHHHGR